MGVKVMDLGGLPLVDLRRSMRASCCRVALTVGIAVICLVCLAWSADSPAKPTSVRELLASGQEAYELGALSLAVERWQRAANLAGTEATPEHIDVLLNLGRAYQSLGRYSHAALALETAVALAGRSQDEGRAVASKNSLGAVLTVLRIWDRAEALLVEALVAAENRSDEAAQAVVLDNLGNLYAARGDHEDAAQQYARGLALARRAGAVTEAARILANAAVSAAAAGDFPSADAHDGEASELARLAQDSPDKAYVLLTMGQTDECLLRALPRDRGRLLRRAFDSYRQALNAARRWGDRRTESYALGYLGHLYETEERIDEALRLSRRAAFVGQEIQAPELLYRWQWQTGRLLKAQGQLEAAQESLRQAVATFEPIRQEVAGGIGNRSLLVGFREAVGAMYYDLADVELQLADRADSAEVSAKLIVGARQAVETFKTSELVDYFRDRCLEVARAEAREIEALAPGTAVVYVVPLADRIEIIVSHASGLQRVKSPVTSAQLTAEVRHFRRQLEDRTSHRYRTSAERLYGWMVRPIEGVLAAADVKTLVFVPDGALRTIPMAALHDGKEFLVERYAVAVAPGLTLVAPRSFDPAGRSVLMCGISEPVGGYSALPYVPMELEKLGTLSGGRQLMNATFCLPRLEEEVASVPPEVLHIASHGQFSSDPTKTFILTHDGRLTLDELEMLIRPSEFRGRPVELLSLSACETAAGDDRAALGLAGVALKAGARSAMASLWFVNDEASARLVSAFYERLYREPGLSKARALQAAQVATMQDTRYRHPCYWAPYLIIGSWL